MIFYSGEHSSEMLQFSDGVLDHFRRHRQLEPNAREAGGQLFARFDGILTQIQRATGPHVADCRSRFEYIPNRSTEHREIRQFFKQGLHFVGDWHTHPESIPTPSLQDLESIHKVFSKSHHELVGFVLVIVGTARWPDGLFVSVYGNNGLQKLVPRY